MVVLHELRGDTVFGKRFEAVAFRKKSSVIAKAGGGDDDDTGEWGLINSKRQNFGLIIIVMVINGAQWR